MVPKLFQRPVVEAWGFPVPQAKSLKMKAVVVATEVPVYGNMKSVAKTFKVVSVGSRVGYGGAYEIDIDQLYKLSDQEAYCICRSY